MFHVKHLSPTPGPPLLPEAIRDALRAVDVSCDIAQARLLADHSAAVVRANTTMNLTRITDNASMLVGHIVDSSLGMREVDQCPAGRLVDLGSGAGYPGIVLAILTGRPTTLVESVKKKAAFLHEWVTGAALDIDVRAQRAEEVALEDPCGFAVVTARAVAPLASLTELAAPLLLRGGRLVAYKGQPGAAELAAGDKVASIVGMRALGLSRLPAPESLGERCLVVYEKVGSPSIPLPRRSGSAQRRPLAE